MASEAPLGPSKALIDDAVTFHNWGVGLDNRLLKSVARQGMINPTLVQSKCVPLALAGKDLLVRARTGSGKTLAYLLPLLQKLLAAHDAGTAVDGTIKALVLVPTRELVEQAADAVDALIHFMRDACSMLALGGAPMETQKAQLRSPPDVLIATPGRLVSHLKQGSVVLTTVETLVVDEADMVLSFGYADDIRTIVSHLPKICQSFLMSATLSPELEDLKRLVLTKPAILRLEGGESDGTLSQFYVSLPSKDKFLVLYVLVRLELISGKAIFFVNSVDMCYRLKLFLDQFSINAAVLNAELPVNSRLHILKQFNKGLFDYLIATDESVPTARAVSAARKVSAAVSDSDSGSESDGDSCSDGDDDDASGSESEEEGGSESDGDDDNSSVEEQPNVGNGGGAGGGAGAGAGAGDAGSSEEEEEGSADEKAGKQLTKQEQKKKDKAARRKKARKAKQKQAKAKQAKGGRGGDAEFGVARGVDFKDVTTVVNVDLPVSVESYTHRIGRTARGGASGAALSFVSNDIATEVDLLAAIQKEQDADEAGKAQPCELPFDLREVGGFRYRVESAMSAITKLAVKETRLEELRKEMLNSERLQAHFEDNPRDLQVLQHDRATRANRVDPALKDVPSYLMPASLRAAAAAAKDSAGLGMLQVGADALENQSRGRGRGRRGRKRRLTKDPLRTFAFNAAAFGAGPGNPNMLTGSKSQAGRNEWKKRHGKGVFKRHRATKKRRPTHAY